MIQDILHELSNFLGFGGAGAGGFAVWQSRENKKDVEKLEAKLEALSILVASNYSKEDLNYRFDRVDNTLMRIIETLEKKADK